MGTTSTAAFRSAVPERPLGLDAGVVDGEANESVPLLVRTAETDNSGMSLFAVERGGENAALVIEAAVAVAAEGLWVFRADDDRPVAALPTADVRAIDALEAGDARGRAWAPGFAPDSALTPLN